MGYMIVRKQELIPGQTAMMVISAPQVAKKCKPGNFIILRIHEQGERIPLTIADADPEAGTVTIVFLAIGKSTAHLLSLKEGEELLDVCGPLGKPTNIKKYDGPVICVGGGTGVAAMHHIAKGHHVAGNHVIAIVGARNKDLLLFCNELGNFCPELLIATDDGSQGHKGFVTEVLKERLEEDKTIAEVVAIGPVPMMGAVAETTLPFGVKTTVSLNSIMLDGIGMCGACRCTVGGETKFACVDGPEFDGHKVDFKELWSRLGQFKKEEALSWDKYKEMTK